MTTSPSIRNGPGTGRRAGLDRADMVAAATALVVEEGPAALTMRRLATQLGVTTTTIYWHVGGRDELVEAVITAQARRFAAATPRGDTARERVTDAARQVWRHALDNRAITSLAHQTGTTALLEHPLEVALAKELTAAGLHGRALATALRSILTTVGGFLVLALRDEGAIAPHLRREALWTDTDGLPPDTVAALAEPVDLEAVFTHTLEAVVTAHVP